MGEIVVKIKHDAYSNDALWAVVHGLLEREGMTMSEVKAVIVDKQSDATGNHDACEGGSCCERCGETA